MLKSRCVSIWEKKAGCTFTNVTRLSGGVNGAVFRCTSQSGSSVVKEFRQLETDALERMDREVAFLKYAKDMAPGHVPEILLFDREARFIAIEHIEGRPILDSIEIERTTADQSAILFLEKLNKGKEDIFSRLPPAKEGFHRLTDHLNNVGERLGHLETSSLSDRYRNRAERVIVELELIYKRTVRRVVNEIDSGKLLDNAKKEWLIVSPGDFGSHNAIKDDSTIKYIDFEFSGIDDAMKTCIDYELNPNVDKFYTSSPLLRFVQCAGVRIDAIFDARYEAMRRILRLKWCCIILGCISRGRRAHLMNAIESYDHEAMVQKQLDKCAVYLDRSIAKGITW